MRLARPSRPGQPSSSPASGFRHPVQYASARSASGGGPRPASPPPSGNYRSARGGPQPPGVVGATDNFMLKKVRRLTLSPAVVIGRRSQRAGGRRAALEQHRHGAGAVRVSVKVTHICSASVGCLESGNCRRWWSGAGRRRPQQAAIGQRAQILRIRDCVVRIAAQGLPAQCRPACAAWRNQRCAPGRRCAPRMFRVAGHDCFSPSRCADPGNRLTLTIVVRRSVWWCEHLPFSYIPSPGHEVRLV